MSTNAPHTPGEFGEPPVRTGPTYGPLYYVRKGLKALASLQLTVVLFVLGMLLIFFGTMAQIDNGIWTVVDKYFYSMVVWVPFELFHKFLTVFWKEQFPANESAWGGTFPFPAGQLIGGAMLVNLLAAHARDAISPLVEISNGHFSHPRWDDPLAVRFLGSLSPANTPSNSKKVPPWILRKMPILAEEIGWHHIKRPTAPRRCTERDDPPRGLLAA